MSRKETEPTIEQILHPNLGTGEKTGGMLLWRKSLKEIGIKFTKKWHKCNSVVQYTIAKRRKRVLELGKMGLTQAQIAKEIGCSYATVKRDIKAIRETLD